MGIKHFKAYTPSRRNMTVLTNDEITKKTPEKSLLESKKKNAERNDGMNKLRRKNLREITDQLEMLQELLQELQEQEEEYRDNMPENLQGSEKYERADEACSNLSDAYDSLQDTIDNITAAIES